MKWKFKSLLTILSLSLSLSLSIALSGIETANADTEHIHTSECGNGDVHHHTGSPTENTGCYSGTSYTVQCDGTIQRIGYDSEDCEYCGSAVWYVTCNSCKRGGSTGCSSCYPAIKNDIGNKCTKKIVNYHRICGLEEGLMYGDRSRHANCNHCGYQKKLMYEYSLNVLCPSQDSVHSGQARGYHTISTCSNPSCKGNPTVVIQIDNHYTTYNNCSYSYNVKPNLKEMNIMPELINYCLGGCIYEDRRNGGFGGYYYLTTDDIYDPDNPTEMKCSKIVTSIAPNR